MLKLITYLLYIFVLVDLLEGSSGGKESVHQDATLSSNITRRFRYESAPGMSVYAEEIWPRKYVGKDTSGGVTKQCMQYLDGFSNATTKFLKCVLTNARPQHYCENCVGEFSSVNNAYDIITNDEVKNGTTCEDELLRADNVQVVLLAYDFVQNVWEKSTCHNCYYSTEVNGTIKYHATDETVKMLEKIQDTQECFHDFSDNAGNLSVCTMCKAFYSKANTYYNYLESDEKLCSDIKDSMNYTRRMWSKDFHCTISKRDNIKIYGIAIAVGFLPVILYLGAYVYGSYLEKRIVRTRASSVRTPLNEPRVEAENQR